MNYRRETREMGVPRAAQALAPRAGSWFRDVPERYVAGTDDRGRQACGS